MQPSNNSTPNIHEGVSTALRVFGINSHVGFPGYVQVPLSDGCYLACVTANEYWCCDICTSAEQVTQSFTLSVRSDDERSPSQIAREIANLIHRLDQAKEVIGQRWKIQADPEHAGEHPNHDSRFITTEDYDFRSHPAYTSGVIVCAMRDLESIREVASHIVAVHNAHLDVSKNQQAILNLMGCVGNLVVAVEKNVPYGTETARILQSVRDALSALK